MAKGRVEGTNVIVVVAPGVTQTYSHRTVEAALAKAKELGIRAPRRKRNVTQRNGKHVAQGTGK